MSSEQERSISSRAHAGGIATGLLCAAPVGYGVFEGVQYLDGGMWLVSGLVAWLPTVGAYTFGHVLTGSLIHHAEKPKVDVHVESKT
jgi:hypothetical protein